MGRAGRKDSDVDGAMIQFAAARGDIDQGGRGSPAALSLQVQRIANHEQDGSTSTSRINELLAEMTLAETSKG